MPRPPRPSSPGLLSLVDRGVRKCPIYTDDESRRHFLGLLDETMALYEWELHSWCLLTNHFHMLVTTVEPTVSAGMQYLNGCYAQWYDWRHGYEGHVFERRFWSDLIQTDWHFFEAARYIVLNPVRARLCTTARTGEWSSYRAMIGMTTKVPKLSTMAALRVRPGLEQASRTNFAAFIREAE